jgi:hypothetical protein
LNCKFSFETLVITPSLVHSDYEEEEERRRKRRKGRRGGEEDKIEDGGF